MKRNIRTFSDRVVEAVLSIPPGKVTTYGRIARAAGGGAMSSQSITGILGKAHKERNLKIPFHRIVYADGSIWVHKTYHKKRMAQYKKEGIEILKNNKIKNFYDILFEFR